ncbi:MAG: M48 family metallopeptidase [Xanthomonadales bacterium]|nr:M48 family metallopeptidase [Xanthomonadales bacterium]
MIAQSLQYGALKIPYQVTFQSTISGKIAIHVLPTGMVRVDAPTSTSLAEIKQGVGKRAKWISGHLSKIHERGVHILTREYVSGESHLYLGRRHVLKVRTSQSEEPSVKLRQGRFEIVVAQQDPHEVHSLFSAWYRAKAGLVFAQRLDLVVAGMPWLTAVPRWRLLSMKRQWGSCSPTGVLSLNPHLIKAPPACIDYVLTHELCHLKHHNHGKQFYQLLDRQLPEWSSIKLRLDDMAEYLLS